MKLELTCLFVLLTTPIFCAEDANVRELAGLAPNQKHWTLGAQVYDAYHGKNYSKVISLCTAGLTGNSDPNQRSFLFNYRAAAFRDEKQFGKALSDYDEAIRLNPSNALAHAGRAFVYAVQQKPDLAMRDLNTAIQLNPHFSSAYGNRAALHQGIGELDAAINDFDSELRLAPNDPDGYINRGIAYYCKGDLRKAKSDLDRGLALPIRHNATQMATFNALAWLHATSPEAGFRDGRVALAEATKALKLKGWNDPDYLDTLAAAHAECGNFEEAIRYQEQALSAKQLSAAKRSQFQGRLQLYRAHKPYREDHESYLARTREARSQITSRSTK